MATAYPFMYQWLGTGGADVYQQDPGPGVQVSGSVGISSSGFPGTAVGLLAILGGLTVLYLTTRSIQGSR